MKGIKLLLAAGIAYLVIIPPAEFLLHVMWPHPIFRYSNERSWIYDDGELAMKADCGYSFFTSSGTYLAFCLDGSKKIATDELDSLFLSKSLEAPPSVFAEYLNISNDPFKRKICFKAKNFIKQKTQKFWRAAYPIEIETSLFFYPKPVTRLNEIDVDDLVVRTFSDYICPEDIDEMTLIAVGNREATFYDKNFDKALRDDMDFILPEVTQSGGLLFVEGKEMKKTKTDNGTLFEAPVPVRFTFSIGKEIHMYSELAKPLFHQSLVLIITAFSAWILVVKALIENIKYLFKLFSRESE